MRRTLEALRERLDEPLVETVGDRTQRAHVEILRIPGERDPCADLLRHLVLEQFGDGGHQALPKMFPRFLSSHFGGVKST